MAPGMQDLPTANWARPSGEDLLRRRLRRPRCYSSLSPSADLTINGRMPVPVVSPGDWSRVSYFYALRYRCSVEGRLGTLPQVRWYAHLLIC
jgi:hypothetical protein